MISAGIAQAQAWVQVEAQPTLTQAETRARAYAQDFPNVFGYRLRSGWYAIAIGPFSADDAISQLRALRSERLIPSDSFVADGSNFGQQFWPAGAPADQPPAMVPAPVAPDAGTIVAAPLPPVPAMPDSAAPAVEAAPPAPVEETPAEARRSEAALTQEDRMALQTALQWDGFYNSAIDGAIGPGSRSAMAAWQASKGYDTTGVLTSRQRDELLGGYKAAMASLGLEKMRDNTVGIEIEMPMAMVAKGAYQPPFAHYDPVADSGVRVILISQQGDKATLFGLYDILQTLEIMPLDGPRQKGKQSFTIDGANAQIVSHAEAELTDAGNVKGFILIWPAGDDKRRELVLTAMRSSFQALPDAVLPDTAGQGGQQDIDLLSGLQIRRPDVSASGFYFDDKGDVLTSAAAVAQCGRITLDDEIEAEVAVTDAALGVAVLVAKQPLVPIGYARLQPAEPRLGSEIAISGYAYDGRLGAPVLTFGRLEDVKGLDGAPGVNRLSLRSTPGDAGGPVFDGSGAVVGMLLAPQAPEGTVLPAEVRFAAPAMAIAEFLSNHGYAAAAAEPAGDLAPEVLTGRARDMTVHVSCWN